MANDSISMANPDIFSLGGSKAPEVPMAQTNPLALALSAAGMLGVDPMALPAHAAPPMDVVRSYINSGKTLPDYISDRPSAISPEQRAILDHIAAGESGGKPNVLFGGKTFDDYSAHPNVRTPIPGNPGQVSTAAGRYQFLHDTWNRQAQKLGLKDFSPASQDTAAWDLASNTYKQSTGRNILDDAKTGHVDWNSLSSQWTSLKGQGPGGTTTAAPSGPGKEIAANAGPAPNPQSGKMLKLALLQAMMPHLSFAPVDYDPFAVKPKL